MHWLYYTSTGTSISALALYMLFRWNDFRPALKAMHPAVRRGLPWLLLVWGVGVIVHSFLMVSRSPAGSL